MTDWDVISTVAEVVAALGVIASLLYVAKQVKSSESTAADTNRLVRAEGVREMMLAAATNDDMRNSVISTLGLKAHYEEMARVFDVSFDDAARTDLHNVYYFWLHWGQFASTKDPDDLEELKKVIRYYVNPAFRYSWDNSVFAKSGLSTKFIKFVDEIIEDSLGE